MIASCQPILSPTCEGVGRSKKSLSTSLAPKPSSASSICELSREGRCRSTPVSWLWIASDEAPAFARLRAAERRKTASPQVGSKTRVVASRTAQSARNWAMSGGVKKAPRALRASMVSTTLADIDRKLPLRSAATNIRSRTKTAYSERPDVSRIPAVDLPRHALTCPVLAVRGGQPRADTSDDPFASPFGGPEKPGRDRKGLKGVGRGRQVPCCHPASNDCRPRFL